MLTSAQYRAKAIQYGALEKVTKSPSARREYQGLEEIFSALADNQQWLVENQRRTGGRIHSDVLAEVGLAVDEERMLRSLGVAVILEWDTLPAKLQREISRTRVRWMISGDNAVPRAFGVVPSPPQECRGAGGMSIPRARTSDYAALDRWDNEGGACGQPLQNAAQEAARSSCLAPMPTGGRRAVT